MTIADVQKNLDTATLTLTTEYPATPERVWRLWADPRQLERWWGPPTHPATVTDHDLTAGGVVRYFMTGPDGGRYHGGWRVLGAEPPHRLEFEDFFADDEGREIAEMPVSSTVVTIGDAGSGVTRMAITTSYASTEAMQKVLDMGLEEGITQALAQIDAILAEEPATA